MELKFRNIKYLFYKSNRKQLAIVSSMIGNTSLGICQIVLSCIKLSLFLGFSGIFYVVLALGKYFALERLLRLEAKEDKIMKNAEIKSIDRINNCTLICSFLFFCFGIVITFFYEEPANYDLLMISYISILTIIKFCNLIVSALITLKRKSGPKYYVKLMSAAAVMISLAVTQRAILYFAEVKYASVWSGVAGIFFSILAILIGLFMISKTRKEKRILISQNLIDASCLKEYDIKEIIKKYIELVRKIAYNCFQEIKKIYLKIIAYFRKVFKRH